jgi:glycosyltransferase 2 family protein
MRAFLLLILQTVITLTLLYWIFSDASVREGVGRVLGGAEGFWLAWAVVAAGVCVLAGAWRWHVFLRLMRFQVSGLQTTRIAVISGFFNLFLFGAVGGDTAKVVCLNQLVPGRKADALLTIVMDHLSGFVVLLLLTLSFTLGRYDYFMRSPLAAGMLWGLIGFVTLSLVGLGACLVAARWKMADRIRLPEVARQKIRQVDAAFCELTHQWQKSLAACLISVLVTLSYFLTFYFASRAVQGGVSLGEMLTVMPVIDVMSALPISVSGLGVREKSFEALLGVVAQVPIESAVMISLAGFTASLFWSLMGGLVLILQRLAGHRGSWSALRGKAAEPTSGGEA